MQTGKSARYDKAIAYIKRNVMKDTQGDFGPGTCQIPLFGGYRNTEFDGKRSRHPKFPFRGELQ